MARFLKGNELNAELEKILDSAEQQVLLVSPYIKLHDRYKSSLRALIEKPEVEVVVLFGKNEEDISKSIQKEDLEFLMEFPNIQIRYEKRLHAKYYANERKALLTSMNLYDFSQNNNIEAGILMESSFKHDNEMDGNTWNYFNQVIDQSVLLFHNVPKFDRKAFIGSKKYVGSEIVVDKLPKYYKRKSATVESKPIEARKPAANAPKVEYKASKKPTGYCIRTGKEIPFNPKRPMCDEAYRSWSQFGNEEYPERYCHFSGEPSNGETTYLKPILYKNWKKAKEVWG